MNKSEFAGLSYKELQSIASKYQVPGNIKKKILIKVLDSLKAGDRVEVEKLLNDVQSTRKKRTKKIKPGKINEKSLTLPTRCSNYSEENYVFQVPYQWGPQNLPIPPEEQISKDEKLVVPNYAEFRKFLMQSSYTNDLKVNERQYMNPSVVDLRVGDTSLVQAIPLDLHRGKNIFMPNEQDIPNLNYEIIETENNFQSPVILKKMLQAPMGVNLKEIASTDRICKVISKNDSLYNSFMDDSDTLTAESESNCNDDIDNNYYCIINNEKNSFNPNSNVGLHNGINEVNNSFTTDNENQYRVIYQAENHSQKWTDNNFLNQHQLLSNPELYQTIYFDNIHTNKNNTQLHCDFVHNQAPYEINQVGSNSSEVSYYHENSINQFNNHVFHNYNQRGHDINTGYHPNCIRDNNDFLSGLNSSQSSNYGNVIENESNLSNRSGGYCLGYDNSTDFIGENNNSDNNDNSTINNSNNSIEKNNSSKDYLTSVYWPHWTQINSLNNHCLENVLNLRNPQKVDNAKIHETSSVYCYSAPVSSPKPLTELTKICSQKKRFVAETRQNSLSTKYEIYDDSSTGRNMANSHALTNSTIKHDNHGKQAWSFDASNENLNNSVIDYSLFNCEIQLSKSTEA